MAKRRYTPADTPQLKGSRFKWIVRELRRIASSITSIIQELETTGITKDLLPYQDNAIDLGASAQAYKDIYSVNTVTVTSDAREKKTEFYMTADELAVAKELTDLPILFKWKDGKPDDKKHMGVVAQHVIRVFKTHGLNPFDYGVVYDGGARYSVRYGELAQWQMAGMKALMQEQKQEWNISNNGNF